MERVAIIGGGESGVGTALLAKKNGYEVFVSDYGTITESYKRELISHDILFEEGGHSFDIILSSNIIVKSPGVSIETSIIRKLIEHKKPYVSEIEFSYGYTNAKIIGITGSNGKTTTSGLVFHLLETAGLRVSLAGNIGTSFARTLCSDSSDYYVLELSSFQLDDIQFFKADVAILLNITPDHLDRYQNDFDLYAEAKFKITNKQTDIDFLIINDLDPMIAKNEEKWNRGQSILRISADTNTQSSLSTDGQYFFDIRAFNLLGVHNRLNALFAIHVAQILGVSNDQIQKGLDSFENVSHRMEQVADFRGVKVINDSKATNVDAVFYALQSVDRPIVWIAGGTDKGNDYTQLTELVDSNVKHLICLGKDNQKLKRFFEDKIERIEETQDVETCIEMAFNAASEGDVILLSPACASFDLFNNYEHRGDAFKKATLDYIKMKG